MQVNMNPPTENIFREEKMETQKKNKSQGKTVTVKGKWKSADDIPSIYANNVYITHGGIDQFYLIFGEMEIPMNLGLGLEGEKMPEFFNIKPVAKIVLAPRAMLMIAEAINSNINKYLSSEISEIKEIK